MHCRPITRAGRRSPSLRPTVLTAALLTLLAGVFPHPAAGQNQIPEEFRNLKVLPEDITPRDLLQTMRGFAVSLGVRCQFCHVGTEEMPLSEFDFVSDEKEHKRRARIMLEMVATINRDFMPRLVSGETPIPSVTCMTCHRGKSQPEVEGSDRGGSQPPPLQEAVAHQPRSAGSGGRERPTPLR